MCINVRKTEYMSLNQAPSMSVIMESLNGDAIKQIYRILNTLVVTSSPLRMTL